MLSDGNQHFATQYVIPEQYCDPDGLCLSAQVIQAANQQIRQLGQAKVESVETKRERQNAPLLLCIK